MKSAMFMLAASVAVASGCVNTDVNGKKWVMWHNEEHFDCDWFAHIGNCAAFGDVFKVDGISANEACCECAGGSEHPITLAPIPTMPAKECAAKTLSNGMDWEVEVKGVRVTCEWFAFENRCGHSGHKFSDEQIKANEACCECGGGHLVNPGTPDKLCPNGVMEAGQSVSHFEYGNDEDLCWRLSCDGMVKLNIVGNGVDTNAKTELIHDTLAFFELGEKGWDQVGRNLSGVIPFTPTNPPTPLVFKGDVLAVFNSDHILTAEGFGLNWVCENERRVAVHTGEMGSAGAHGTYNLTLERLDDTGALVSNCPLGTITNPKAGDVDYLVMTSETQGYPLDENNPTAIRDCNVDPNVEKNADGSFRIVIETLEGGVADSWYVDKIEVETGKGLGTFLAWTTPSKYGLSMGDWQKSDNVNGAEDNRLIWSPSVYSQYCKETVINQDALDSNDQVIIEQTDYENDLHICYVIECVAPTIIFDSITTEANHDFISLHSFETVTEKVWKHDMADRWDSATTTPFTETGAADTIYTVRFDTDDNTATGGYKFTVDCSTL